jgi:hypothetical protein
MPRRRLLVWSGVRSGVQDGTSDARSGVQDGTSDVRSGAQEQLLAQVQLPAQVPDRNSNSTGSAKYQRHLIANDRSEPFHEGRNADHPLP